ncbi:serine hydroxymethyltransferase [Candidatus Campbellbacteria bacterium]|nr:serine hydroxymethyltransferase [Candidatus Campbellbacteria bacterium]|tara:strand:+ start:3052 stop:4263 length:1212 start_codon:yes stop_codon:yes gene_type:complete
MKDTKVKNLLAAEKKRQKSVINLVASENYVSDDVLKALGTETTNKYAEGYPGARYYGGNEVIDKIENLAIDRALKLFKLNPKKWGVNVQPHSGSPANIAVYQALVPQGGKIMGMSLAHGGHLTHGHGVSFSGKFWQQVPYGVSEKNEKIDYDELLKIAKKEKPDIVVTGYSAYPRKINFKKMREVADAAGAYLMVDMAHISGLIAGGQHPSPFTYADIVTTTTHKVLRGPRGGMIFARQDYGVGKKAPKTKKGKSVPTLFDQIQKSVFPGMQGGPHMNQIAALAVALKEADSASFKKYTEQVIKNTKTLSGELKKRGWRITSGGTDSHVFLMDVWKEGLTGKEASERLEKEGIIVNMNTIPYDTRSPFNPSGLRLGTAAETTRGKKEKDMIALAERIDKILRK